MIIPFLTIGLEKTKLHNVLSKKGKENYTMRSFDSCIPFYLVEQNLFVVIGKMAKNFF